MHSFLGYKYTCKAHRKDLYLASQSLIARLINPKQPRQISNKAFYLLIAFCPSTSLRQLHPFLPSYTQLFFYTLLFFSLRIMSMLTEVTSKRRRIENEIRLFSIIDLYSLSIVFSLVWFGFELHLKSTRSKILVGLLTYM